MGAVDDFYNSIQYTNDEAGQAARERNEATRELANLEEAGADQAAMLAATKKVAAAADNFYRVIAKPRNLSPVSPPAVPAAPLSPPPPPFPNTPPKRPNYAPVVTGEPISTGILIGIQIIGGLLGFFGGGSTKELKRAVGAIRDGLVRITNALTNFIWTIAHNVRWVLNALRALWERVLKPLINHINELTSKLSKIIDRVLKPYLQMIDHLRRQILAIYKKFFLPVIEVIQKIRMLLAFLRLLRVPGVKQLDDKLQRIEAKMIGFIGDLMRRTNEHSTIFNQILTVQMTLQRGPLLNSMFATRGGWINQFYNAQYMPTPDRKSKEPTIDDYLKFGVDFTSDVRQRLLTERSGPEIDFGICHTFREVLLRER